MRSDQKVPLSLALGLGLAGFAILIRSSELVALSLPVIVYALFLVVSTAMLPPSRFTVERAIDRYRAIDGETLCVTTRIINRSGSAVRIVARDRLPAAGERLDGEPSAAARLAPAGALTLSYRIRLPRGVHEIGSAEVTVLAPLGLARRASDAGEATPVRIVPRSAPIERIAISPRRTRGFAGTVRARLGGQGLEFFGCRAYTPGDDVRRINWRAYARRDALVINEYDIERIADVNVIVDARARVHLRVGDRDTFEPAIEAAARVAGRLIAQGNSVGLLIYGDYLHWVFPGTGRGQHDRILDALSDARPSDKPAFEGLDRLPTRLFPPGSQIVLVSPLADTHDVEVVSRLVGRGYAVLLISPNRASLARTAISRDPALRLAERIVQLDRSISLDALTRLGVRAVDWDLTTPLAEAVAVLSRPAGGRR